MKSDEEAINNRQRILLTKLLIKAQFYNSKMFFFVSINLSTFLLVN